MRHAATGAGTRPRPGGVSRAEGRRGEKGRSDRFQPASFPRRSVPARPALALVRRSAGGPRGCRGAMAQRRAAEQGPCQAVAAAASGKHQRQLLEGARGWGSGSERPASRGRCPLAQRATSLAYAGV